MENVMYMHGCKRVLDRFPDLNQIKKKAEFIEKYIGEDNSLVMEASKALIDIVCHTIMADKGVEIDTLLDTPKLVKRTLDELDIDPEAKQLDLDQAVKQGVSGVSNIVSCLCRFRNNCGSLSHGRDGFYDISLDIQAVLAARLADTMVEFLYMAHKSQKRIQDKRISYNSYESENCIIDENNNSIILFDTEFKVSEILFHLSPPLYRSVLSDNGVDIADE